MTKAELIRRIAKNVGVPDTDAKIFFEIFLKRISAVVDTGQSIFVNDFGYFHLIKGRIKKPVFSFKDNEASEEEIGLVLFSEDKDLRKSDIKGLVFNIPFFDEDDYHPIDSSFSLSIGKPLIPLRGVPFDNIYIPTSGYEYRRLMESKVEKIISSSEIAESEENFPILVIDARSYNSNQVQLQWDDKSQTETSEQFRSLTESRLEKQNELSDYEKQTKELKNIAWDFGEDLSRQIEAESILDITDERINMDLIQKVNANREPEVRIQETNDTNEVIDTSVDTVLNNNASQKTEFIEEVQIEDSSEKLNELLNSESKTADSAEEFLVEEIVDDFNNEIIIDEVTRKIEPDIIENSVSEEVKLDINEDAKLEDDISDREFWQSTSKYFEPYKPETRTKSEEISTEDNEAIVNLGEFDSTENRVEYISEPEGVIMSDDNSIEEEINDDEVVENSNEIQELKNDEDKSVAEDRIELEEEAEQKPEFYKPDTRRNLTPFLLFFLLVIIGSVALYWYLEFYSKNENKIKPAQIVLKSENAKIVSRSFDFPITYPYPPKVNQPISSETSVPEVDESNVITEKNDDRSTEEKKPEEKLTVKEIPKPNITDLKKPGNVEIPAGTSLNVGNNVFKYGDVFVVQVASYRASSISENEAGKYRNKGYNAFVEAAEIPNRGTWYRVRVGDFSSKEEALNFISKNIR